jgi:hypothetical protein
MHGGAAGSGAPRGNQNALKQGLYTREAFAKRRQVSELLRQSRELIAKIKMSVGSAPLRRGSMLGPAEYRGRKAMEEPFEKDPVPSTLNHNRPCTTSQGVSFSSTKRGNRTDVTFYLNGEEETSRFIEAFGSQDPDFVFELLRQVANTNSRFADEQEHQIYDVSHQRS